jgi:hypothetical protein
MHAESDTIWHVRRTVGPRCTALAGVALHWPPLTETWGPSSSDDKSPSVALLAALDAPRAKRIQINVNLKVIFEGEEEEGESVVADRWRIRLADVAWWCTTVLNL